MQKTMKRNKRIDPRQLSLFEVQTHAEQPKELDSESLFLSWLESSVPLIHVIGENPHIVEVATFGTDDKEIWLNRNFVDEGLKNFGYMKTHTLTMPSKGKYRVFRKCYNTPRKDGFNG